MSYCYYCLRKAITPLKHFITPLKHLINFIYECVLKTNTCIDPSVSITLIRASDAFIYLFCLKDFKI